MTYYGRYEQTLVAVTIMDILFCFIFLSILLKLLFIYTVTMSGKCVHTENLDNFILAMLVYTRMNVATYFEI